MAARTTPFAPFEFMIAWRYLRARRAEGGVSVMTWISLVGIALGVMALIATLAVRAGFRAEFVDTILGANAHATIYPLPVVDADGFVRNGMPDYEAVADRIRAVPGVTAAVPVIKGQAMITLNDRSNVAEVYGLTLADLKAIPRVSDPAQGVGDINRFDHGIAVGAGIARDLGIAVGDHVRLISPDGAKTAFGTSPRVNGYEVVYVFSAGRYDIDQTRVYMPFPEAQSYFNREGVVDAIQVTVTDPEQVDRFIGPLAQAAGPDAQVWTWRDSAGAFLNALSIEDDVMFVILSILVLIASMNITSGLVMLVKNKGRDIGILRTMGLTEGSVLRVFFLCGAFTGVIGTIAGVDPGLPDRLEHTTASCRR